MDKERTRGYLNNQKSERNKKKNRTVSEDCDTTTKLKYGNRNAREKKRTKILEEMMAGIFQNNLRHQTTDPGGL